MGLVTNLRRPSIIGLQLALGVNNRYFEVTLFENIRIRVKHGPSLVTGMLLEPGAPDKK